MKVVVTGAAGHLGSHLIPMLLVNGWQVIGIDMMEAASTTGYSFRKMTLSDRKALPSVLNGADLVVHAASIHPWKLYQDEEYLDANIKGTWQLYSAMAECDIRKVVLTSSIAATGYHEIPTTAWPVSESEQFPIGDLYSFTKYTQEQAAKHFAFRPGIQTFALRPPAFMPLSKLETGFSLTANFAVVDDIARAHLMATRVLLEGLPADTGTAMFEAFFTVNRLPYTAADGPLLGPQQDVSPLVEKYWPDKYGWMQANGFNGRSIAALYDISKAKRWFGWEPLYNFEQWADEYIC